MKIHRAMDKLQRAILRLRKSEGRVARRNARTELAAALRAVRAAVDECFPPIRKPETSDQKKWNRTIYGEMSQDQRKERHSRRMHERNKRLSTAGFYPIPAGRQAQVLRDCAAAGVRVVLVGSDHYPWVKSWVLHARPGDISQLREANRSISARKAILAEAILRDQVRKEDGSLPEW